jgi:hypothetical protein
LTVSASFRTIRPWDEGYRRPEAAVSDEQVVLKLSGSDSRNGQIPVEAFAAAVRRFASIMAYFERIYTDRPKRSSDLNIVDLSRENPLVIRMRPTSRQRGYWPRPAYHWGFSQLASIGRGGAPDARVPPELLENLYDLAHAEPNDSIVKTVAQYEDSVIDFNGEAMPSPQWFAGVSRGAIVGELRGVTDIDGEREFFVCPPSGPRRVKCVFTEDMRQDMNRLLFRTVRIVGMLYHGGSTPYPTLVEAEKITEIQDHSDYRMRDLEGLFNNGYYPIEGRWPQ